MSKIRWGFQSAIQFIGAKFKNIYNPNANINNQIYYLYSKLNNEKFTASRLDDQEKMDKWIKNLHKKQYLIATPNPYYHHFDEEKFENSSHHYSKINPNNIRFFALGGFDENLLSSSFNDYNPVFLALIKEEKFISIHKLSVFYNTKFVFGIKVKYKIVDKKGYKHTIIRSHMGKEYQTQKYFSFKKSHHFKSNENISRIYGTSGLAIESLYFEISSKDTTKKIGGGDKTKEGKEFNISFSNHENVFAFGGNIGDYLDYLYGYYFSH